MFDNLITRLDKALRTLHNVGSLTRENPSYGHDSTLDDNQKRHSAGLMRINHVGEVCAQALYSGQALTAKTIEVQQFNEHAAVEEMDHLLWCNQRLLELGYKQSVLNPLWYAGALIIGVVAGLAGDKVSLGFVKETETQVTQHLASHESLLPLSDKRSLAIVLQMKADEMKHHQQAHELGGYDLPSPIRMSMKVLGKMMTMTAYYV